MTRRDGKQGDIRWSAELLVSEAQRERKDWKVNAMNSRRWALEFYPALLFLCTGLLSDLSTNMHNQQVSIKREARAHTRRVRMMMLVVMLWVDVRS